MPAEESKLSKTSKQLQQLDKSNEAYDMSLLQIDEKNDAEWFEQFALIEDELTQTLVLVACLHSQDLITLKESQQMKQFLLTKSETQIKMLVKAFMCTKSLYSWRSEFRGKMGIPRQRFNDSCSSRSSLKKKSDKPPVLSGSGMANTQRGQRLQLSN